MLKMVDSITDIHSNFSLEHPYYSLNQFLRRQFGEKVVRVSVNLHQPCPNRDDGNPGCIFCLPESYEPLSGQCTESIPEQVSRGSALLSKFYRARKFMAYFQSGSNTAGPVALLDAAYREALACEHVVGISISTRPDCLSPEIVDVLKKLAQEYTVWVELGVQTCHDDSLALLNRGHDTACSARAIDTLLNAGINHIVAHMILGIPNETEEQMHQSFTYFSNHGIHGFKIHHLHVVKGTPLEKMYINGDFSVLSLDEYARVVVDILEHTPPDKVIHRLFGSTANDYLIAPVWPGKKAQQLQRILKEFKNRNTWQGKKLET